MENQEIVMESHGQIFCQVWESFKRIKHEKKHQIISSVKRENRDASLLGKLM